MGRKIKYIFVHCTASWQLTTSEQSLRDEFKAKGWKAPGYHYVVKTDGNIIRMLDENKVANGVKGYNDVSIHVAYIGGIGFKKDKDGKDTKIIESVDNRTPAQRLGLFDLLVKLKQKYPSARILGHRDISPDLNCNGVIDAWERIKDCPCFDAEIEYADINDIGT